MLVLRIKYKDIVKVVVASLILVTICVFVFTVRTALVALIAFMPTNPNGALGSLDYKKEERRVLAVKSREAAPKFGNSERQQLIDEVCCS